MQIGNGQMTGLDRSGIRMPDRFNPVLTTYFFIYQGLKSYRSRNLPS